MSVGLMEKEEESFKELMTICIQRATDPTTRMVIDRPVTDGKD